MLQLRDLLLLGLGLEVGRGLLDIWNVFDVLLQQQLGVHIRVETLYCSRLFLLRAHFGLDQ